MTSTYRDGPLRPTTPDAIRDMLNRFRSQQPAPDRSAPTAVRRRYIESLSLLSYSHLTSVTDVAHYWISRHAHTGQPSKIILMEGPFHAGKTQCAQRLVLDVCARAWADIGEEVVDEQGRHMVIPAVYVPSPGGGEANLMRAIAHGLMLPDSLTHRARDTAHDLLRRVAAACRRNRTEVIVLDDVHLLSHGRGTHMTKFLKELFETVPATLVMVGHDLDNSVVLKAGTQSDLAEKAAATQLRRRAVRLSYEPIERSDDGVREWRDLAVSVVEAMPLARATRLTQRTLFDLAVSCQGRRADLIELLLVAGSLAVGAEEMITDAQLAHATQMCGIGRVNGEGRQA